MLFFLLNSGQNAFKHKQNLKLLASNSGMYIGASWIGSHRIWRLHSYKHSVQNKYVIRTQSSRKTSNCWRSSSQARRNGSLFWGLTLVYSCTLVPKEYAEIVKLNLAFCLPSCNANLRNYLRFNRAQWSSKSKIHTVEIWYNTTHAQKIF